ncbi:glycosyl transferase group 1 [Desulfovibrio sp. X2]|uniref:glycosyltransferase family 4 protein n=1 Tax=Desulfovibrio sp. X2 TaxID=941449 RepID=UPI000358DB83|nr:glycosyltransferase family 4 protein [Desulfovibrio sp. X2]EPR42749.1 glycosyl transferase group 1 [Desulfovibrio sp. X2]
MTDSPRVSSAAFTAARPGTSAGSPPRVALLVERLSTYGGTEGFAWRLAKALTGRGHAVEMVCARQETDPPPGVGVITVGRPPLLRWLKTAWFALAAERVRRRRGYTVTVSCGNTLAQDIARVSGGPLDVFHEKSIRAYPPGLPRLFKRLKRALSPANAVVRAVQKRQFADGGRIVCVSHLVREWMASSFSSLSIEDMGVVYNRPDLARYHVPSREERRSARERFGLAPGEYAVGLAGTNFMLKGVATAVSALAELPENTRLLVAGGRAPERFLRQARELGVAERVRFLGRVADMAGFYHACDLFVLPTYYDTCSNVVLEARACGLPAITTRSNGAGYFLEDRWLLDDAADHHALAGLIRTASESPGLVPFAWPEDVPAGIEPYVRMVEELLG